MQFEKFTKQYSLSKTLRFELKPVGETADYIDEYQSDYIKSIVQGDTKRYERHFRWRHFISLDSTISHWTASMNPECGACDSDLSILGNSCQQPQLRSSLGPKSSRAESSAVAAVR